jgi:hypothetical protein
MILAYYGHHKAGSTWILHVVGAVCSLASLKMVSHHYEQFFDGDIEGYRKSNPFDFWCYINADYIFVRYLETKGFHVIRDPRDVIVSGYFSHLNSHPDEYWPRLRHYRKYLRSLSKEEGLLREMEFSSIFLSHMMSWDYHTPSILQLKFEDLIKDPFGNFVSIFHFLDMIPNRISEADLHGIVNSYSFENLSGGRKSGVEDHAHHYRKGVPGDWKNHFTEEHVDYFKKLYNPLLIKLGYETREDW